MSITFTGAGLNVDGPLSEEEAKAILKYADAIRLSERERIIALLETEATIYADALLDPTEVIALIKREHNA